MVLFLLIAVTYMARVEADSSRIREVAVAYTETRDSLYKDLYAEFKDDLPKWKAEASMPRRIPFARPSN